MAEPLERLRPHARRPACPAACAPSAASVGIPRCGERLGLAPPRARRRGRGCRRLGAAACRGCGSRRSRSGRTARGTSRASLVERGEEPLRASAGSRPCSRRCETSPARRCRARRGSARAAAPGSARAARRRSRAGARAPASRERASFVSTGSYVPSGWRSRKSANPRQVPSVRYGLVDDVRLAGADRLLGEPPRLVGVEALVVVGRACARSRGPSASSRARYASLVLVPLAADEVAVACRRGAAARARRAARGARAASGAGRRGGCREVGGRETQRAVRGESHHSEYQRTSSLCLRFVSIWDEPDERLAGHEAGEEWFYRRGAGPSRWMRVVVHYERGSGRTGQARSIARTGESERGSGFASTVCDTTPC